MDIGGDHGCAIVNGLAKCWGGNYVGNLGIGNTDSPMLSPQNVKEILQNLANSLIDAAQSWHAHRHEAKQP